LLFKKFSLQLLTDHGAFSLLLIGNETLGLLLGRLSPILGSWLSADFCDPNICAISGSIFIFGYFCFIYIFYSKNPNNEHYNNILPYYKFNLHIHISPHGQGPVPIRTFTK
jgi:hypothetical protein